MSAVGGGMVLDKTDIRILDVLASDARLSYRQIGKRVAVSAATAMTRVKKLEQEGIIRRYSAILNHERLGYELTAITEITVSKGKLLEMEKEIAKHPCVCAVYDVTGLTDAIVVAKFRNRQDLSDFAKSLLVMPFIERTNTHLVLTTVKEDFRLV